MCSSSHRRVTVLGAQLSQSGDPLADLPLQNPQTTSDLQHRCIIHDIQRGRTPMYVLRNARSYGSIELSHYITVIDVDCQQITLLSLFVTLLMALSSL